MNPIRRQAAIASALMLAAAAGAVAWQPRDHLADHGDKLDLERALPHEFAGWRMATNLPVQLVSPDIQAVLNSIYSQTLSRTYVDGQGRRIMLSVAYGGDQSDATRAHRPEVCYPAQGFQIFSNQASELSLPQAANMPVRRLVARQGGRNEPITYWIIVGQEVVISGFGQKVAQLRYGVRGVVPDGLLMRVSSIDGDVAQAYRLQDRFTADLAAAVAPRLRARFFGNGPGAPAGAAGP